MQGSVTLCGWHMWVQQPAPRCYTAMDLASMRTSASRCLSKAAVLLLLACTTIWGTTAGLALYQAAWSTVQLRSALSVQQDGLAFYGSCATQAAAPAPSAAEQGKETLTGASLGLPPLRASNPTRRLARRSQSSATSEITPVDEDAPMEVSSWLGTDCCVVACYGVMDPSTTCLKCLRTRGATLVASPTDDARLGAGLCTSLPEITLVGLKVCNSQPDRARPACQGPPPSALAPCKQASTASAACMGSNEPPATD